MEYKFYGENDYIIKDCYINPCFDELVYMTESEFNTWALDMRDRIKYIWDTYDTPPSVSKSKEDIIEDFNKLDTVDVEKFLVKEDGKSEKLCIKNTKVGIGLSANRWFPNMMKTRINYSNVEYARSIYDYFSREDLIDTFLLYTNRHFRRDGFYSYSYVLHKFDVEKYSVSDYLSKFIVLSKTVRDWVEEFENLLKIQESEYDYFIESCSDEYTGTSLKDDMTLYFNKDEYEDLCSLVPEKKRLFVGIKKGDLYRIRIFKKGNKIFPKGFKCFRISLCQYAVNFPPLTAKFIYERYAKLLKKSDINIFDPSSGWGGRIIGAMSMKDSFSCHYVGCDPNKDNVFSDGTTRYENLANFYNNESNRSYSLFSKPNTFEIFVSGSEEIHLNENFKKYFGKFDIIFTSPPYFSKEMYSYDQTQSCNKFSEYDNWKSEFLYKTLLTCYNYLSDGGYLIWNIADIVIGNNQFNLENDSIEICKSFGLKHVETLKMLLSLMPGSQRLIDGELTTKNSVKVDGKFFKYEPIFVFKK